MRPISPRATQVAGDRELVAIEYETSLVLVDGTDSTTMRAVVPRDGPMPGKVRRDDRWTFVGNHSIPNLFATWSARYPPLARW